MSIELDDVTSGYNLSVINSNFQKVETYINSTLLHRNGSVAGEAKMGRDLDMDGNTILNANIDGSSITNDRALRVPTGEGPIPALPDADTRKGKVVSFDINTGLPVVIAPASGSAVDVLNQLALPTGSLLIGQVDNFNALRSIVPTIPNQRIKLKSYYTNGVVGGGEFTAKSTTGLVTVPVDDGGKIATVNSSWFWERVEKDKCTVDDFGAISFTDYDGAAGVPSSSVMIQSMFDSLGYIRLAKGMRYIVTTPIGVYGNYWRIFGEKGAIHKRTTEKTGVTTLQNVFGGYADINKNCVFYTKTVDVRYWKISDLSLVCHEAPSDDRPVGFLFPSVQQYAFEGIDTRGCLHSFWFSNAWQGTFRDVRTNQDIQDGWFYDDSRLNSSGVDVGGTGQSATSVVFDKCYANAPGRYGYHIRNADYCTMTNAACDGSGVASYRFHVVNINGNCSSEGAKGEYFNISGESVIDIYSSIYDDLTDNGQYVMTISGKPSVKVSMRGRTGKNNRVNVTEPGADVYFEFPRWWNGISDGMGINNCVSGSFLKIDIGRGAGASRIWVNGVAQEVRETQPAYTTTQSALASYGKKEARIGVTVSTSVLTIPMSRIKEIFPNFNGTNNNYAEWLRIKTTNAAGIAYGAIFFCAANAVVGSKLDAQVTTGNGSAAAVVSAVSANASNLTLTFASALPVGSVVMLEPV